MPFNVSFDSSVNAVQQAAVQAVANFFNAHFIDPVTIDISVSFANLGPGGLGASSYSLPTHTFSQITAALTSDSTSADDATAVANRPAGSRANYPFSPNGYPTPRWPAGHRLSHTIPPPNTPR